MTSERLESEILNLAMGAFRGAISRVTESSEPVAAATYGRSRRRRGGVDEVLELALGYKS